MALYGWALHYGIAIQRDMNQGMKLLQQSQHIIARVLFLMNVGDSTDAYELLTTECDTSDPHVQYLLGQCLWKGWGCSADKPETVRCFKRAGNHLFAQCCLAVFYLYGRGGVQKDLGSALVLLQRAADQGWLDAKCELDVLKGISECRGCVLSLTVDAQAWRANERQMQKAFCWDES
eukprot:TRINITY_DN6675_c0_g6_i2.p2 TRINITY_DN6675_c0_g6~~TRINITY_DN6675_c0_g6_i2.p2  ORF type:complete len:191 (-),score=24.62 TRINITY_DN6675_c0_g6_i2:879-1409(-)